MAEQQDTIYFFGIVDQDSKAYGLSNFTKLPVKIPHQFGFFPWAKEEDLIFPTAEAAFQAYKCPNNEDDVRKFIALSDPKKAKGEIFCAITQLFENSFKLQLLEGE